MPDLTLLGLPSCDTCRKARKALEAAGHTVTFRDVRADPLSPAELAPLLAAFPDTLLNTRSTTWRGLSQAEQQAAPLTQLQAHPTLMKRPVVTDGARTTLGWHADAAGEWGV